LQAVAETRHAEAHLLVTIQRLLRSKALGQLFGVLFDVTLALEVNIDALYLNALLLRAQVAKAGTATTL